MPLEAVPAGSVFGLNINGAAPNSPVVFSTTHAGVAQTVQLGQTDAQGHYDVIGLPVSPPLGMYTSGVSVGGVLAAQWTLNIVAARPAPWAVAATPAPAAPAPAPAAAEPAPATPAAAPAPDSSAAAEPASSPTISPALLIAAAAVLVAVNL